MKPGDVTLQMLKKAVEQATSFRDVCKGVDVWWGGESSLRIQEKVLLWKLDYSHFNHHQKTNNVTLEKVQKALAARKAKKRARNRAHRKVASNRSYYICQDSKKSDRKKGLLGHDLTVEKVEEMIKSGCSYCGEKSIQITLDRIDNSLAHTLANCNAACIRCNVIRRHMPYKAWAALTSRIKEIREEGLFGDWDGSFH